MRFRLSVLMFLLYAAPGATLPLFSLRLHELHFTSLEIGLASATQALAALIAPLLIGQIADRWVPANRCLVVCALLAGMFLWILAELTTPLAVFVCSLCFWLMMGPVLILGAAVCFAQLSAPNESFGRVRMWGTVGWMVPGWLLGYWFCDPDLLDPLLTMLRPAFPDSELADAFRLGGLMAMLLAGYSLTLPHMPPRRQVSARIAPLAALRLLRQRDLALYLLCLFGTCVTLPFTSQVTPLLLHQLGFSAAWVGPLLTLSQGSEAVLLWFLPALQLGWGVRRTLLLGLGMWTTALLVLTVGEPRWLVMGSLVLNGFIISCFVVAGQVFFNGRARGEIRVSAQGLLTMTSGLGLLLGNVLVGWIRQQSEGEFSPTFAVGAAIALMMLAFLALGFRGEATSPDLTKDPMPPTSPELVGPIKPAKSRDPVGSQTRD